LLLSPKKAMNFSFFGQEAGIVVSSLRRKCIGKLPVDDAEDGTVIRINKNAGETEIRMSKIEAVGVWKDIAWKK